MFVKTAVAVSPALPAWLRSLWPAPSTVDRRERLRAGLGALLGIGLTALISHWLRGRGMNVGPWLVAPMGASAVLVFAVPSSPLAQPWAVIGGNTVSALVGVACVHLLGPGDFTAAVAVGAAIGTMFALRCLHPPGGAAALLVALSAVQDPAFAVFPVLTNAALLTLMGLLYNNATGRSYPHMPMAPAAPRHDPRSLEALDAELDTILTRYNQILDISRDDLRALLEDTHLQAYRRRLQNLRCVDVMSSDPVTVRAEMPWAEAWPLFRTHRVKALPVVDDARRLVGIVTPADFMRAAEVDALALPTTQELRGQDGRQVGDIMSRQVHVTQTQRHLAELVPLFGSTGHHHIPVLNQAEELVGMITESDVVAALSRLQDLDPAA